MVGWLDGWMAGWLDGWMVGWLDGWMVGWLDGWMVGWLDGWMVGWLDGWMVGNFKKQFNTMQKNYVKLNDFPAYKRAFHLSNYVWEIVIKWDWFAKKTIGAQFVDAADSISANLAEGFGRYHKKDKVKFYIYSQGSVKECFDWNEKAKVRNLLTLEEYRKIFTELQALPKEINIQIKHTREKLKE